MHAPKQLIYLTIGALVAHMMRMMDLRLDKNAEKLLGARTKYENCLLVVGSEERCSTKKQCMRNSILLNKA